MTSFEWLIGLRYTRAKRRNGFISFISGASMIGITLGVAALITVLSVMNGFQREVRSRILDSASHIKISGPNGQLADWMTVSREVSQHKSVTGAAPFVESQGLVSFDSFQGALIRGVDPALEPAVSAFHTHMRQGKLTDLRPGEYGIILGSGLASMLGVQVGDRIRVFAPDGNVTPAGVMPRFRQFTVTGIFFMDAYQYDSVLALVHITDAQHLYRIGDNVSGVRLKLTDALKAPQVAHEITMASKRPLYVSDWTQENAQYFRAVEIEKRMMFLILGLIIAVASFNLVSGLVMSVTDKQADIAILRTLGASPASIRKIFMIQGAFTGIGGTILGVICGLLLAYNVSDVVSFIERVFSIRFLSAQSYYITELPSEVMMSDVVSIAAVSLILSLLATIYPSRRAAKTQPAEALRYE
ncbi:lipoprotein-releasing ABC transporter permease subunit [Burkholderiaceae bacterium DAT-1]|nr:lipoprotein-releasing ABC transporter permease subunit [Burkholderiaceae bacterium DAT-1]